MKRIKISVLLSIFMISILATSCSTEFKECVSVWNSCQADCPEVDDAAWRECLSGCSSLIPDDPTVPGALDAFNDCLRKCGNPYTERENCLEKCNSGLRECLGVE